MIRNRHDRCSAACRDGAGRRPAGHGGRGLHLGGAGLGGSRRATLLNCASGLLAVHPAAFPATLLAPMTARRYGSRRRQRRLRATLPCGALNYGIDRVRMIEHVLMVGRAAHLAGATPPCRAMPCAWKPTSRRLSAAGCGRWGLRRRRMRRDGLPALSTQYAAGDSTRQALGLRLRRSGDGPRHHNEPKGPATTSYPRAGRRSGCCGLGFQLPVELVRAHLLHWLGHHAQYMSDTGGRELEAAQAAQHGGGVSSLLPGCPVGCGSH